MDVQTINSITKQKKFNISFGKVKTSLLYPIIGGRRPKISARPGNKWNCKDCESHAIPVLYYLIVACLLPL